MSMKTPWLALCVALLMPAAEAQEKMSEHTFKLGSAAKSPPASLADMQWLAGYWVGQAFGGATEEIWSQPKAGSMMGMYRLIRDGKPVLYEFITILEQNGSLVLRIKHFSPDLKGWEEKDKTVDFPLVALGNGAVHFQGMSYHPKGDALTVYLVVSQGGQAREEVFSYTRVPPKGESVERRVAEFAVAFRDADVERLAALLGPTYVHTNGGSPPITREQWLSYITSRRQELRSGLLTLTRYENQDIKIAVQGTVAIVTGVNVSEGRRDGVLFARKLRFTQVWFLGQGGWQRIAFQDAEIAP